MNKWFVCGYTPFSLIKEAIEQKIKAFCGSLKKWKKYANCAYMHQVQRLIQNNLITFETEFLTNHQHHGKRASLPPIIFANQASKQQTRLADFGDIVHKSTKYFRIFFSNQGTLSILGATKLLIVSTNQTRTIANSSQ